jgi:hypothetical protein
MNVFKDVESWTFLDDGPQLEVAAMGDSSGAQSDTPK